MMKATTNSMNANEALKRLQKGTLSSMKITKDKLMEILDYYKKLQVIFVDGDENIIFL
jgi:hypothetical protein